MCLILHGRAALSCKYIHACLLTIALISLISAQHQGHSRKMCYLRCLGCIVHLVFVCCGTHDVLPHPMKQTLCKSLDSVSNLVGAAAFETDAATQQDLALRHNLQQGLLLTVRAQHIMLSLEQIRNLPWEEHVAIWQDYVNALAAHLVSWYPFCACLHLCIQSFLCIQQYRLHRIAGELLAISIRLLHIP